MTRRDFLQTAPAAIALTLECKAFASCSSTIDAAWYQCSRHFLQLPVGRIAFVEHGKGPVALFIHGYPLNSYQWRGALERLHPHRRCIAPDMMGLGYSEIPANQPITPDTQVEMLRMFLDKLKIKAVDLVGNDSGGYVSQLFLAKYPERVRTLLLTNCDVDANNPPAGFVPLIELAKKGLFVERSIVPQLADKNLARSPRGVGVAFSYPEKLSDETIEMYFRPLVRTPLTKSQVDQYAVALGVNELVALRENLRAWKGPVRMVWGLKDPLFPVQWAEWLDTSFPGSRGIRRVEDGNLFFPEEMPDLIAEEATKLWGV
jgi:haloalkane dehalogenase